MTNKDIIKELLWFFLALVLVFFLARCFGQLKKGFFFENLRDHTSLLTNMKSGLTLLISFLLLFPILFLLLSIREAKNKFERRPQNAYLLGIIFVSLISTLVCLTNLKPWMSILYGSWTIYPPLSSKANEFVPPVHFNFYFYLLLLFLIAHVVMAIFISRKVLKY